jgi:hypothetical protein
MASVLNRTTKVYYESVNTPDYPESEWIINPDITALTGVPTKHWKIEPDDTVVEMTEAEKVAYDDEIEYGPMTLEEMLDDKTKDINIFRDNMINGGYTFDGNIYDSGNDARANVTAVSTAIANGLPIPPNFTWRTKNNYNVPMDATKIVTFGIMMMNWVSTVYGVSWYHKDNLTRIVADPSKTDSEKRNILLHYNYKVGYPTN